MTAQHILKYYVYCSLRCILLCIYSIIVTQLSACLDLRHSDNIAQTDSCSFTSGTHTLSIIATQFLQISSKPSESSIYSLLQHYSIIQSTYGTSSHKHKHHHRPFSTSQYSVSGTRFIITERGTTDTCSYEPDLQQQVKTLSTENMQATATEYFQHWNSFTVWQPITF